MPLRGFSITGGLSLGVTTGYDKINDLFCLVAGVLRFLFFFLRSLHFGICVTRLLLAFALVFSGSVSICAGLPGSNEDPLFGYGLLDSWNLGLLDSQSGLN